ncbi:LuxR C-terminal-related transcriptional regulator [Kitasatospora sp. NPDC101155]|uniref:LuxR C-terminal-related transcriptional regulator n=1 Tax=Kitasatospora sp. NPDC101155 TaxID=3364097 RepID=UPI0038291062
MRDLAAPASTPSKAAAATHSPPGPPPRLAPTGDPLLVARFAVPGPPRVLIRRQSLLDRVSEGVEGPITLLNGPAGAGKTVLAAHWATVAPAPGPIVWLTVEPDDLPGTFWAYVLEAFRYHGMPPPEDIGRPARAGEADRSVLIRLAAWLAGSPRPAVLVLDQLDTVSSPEITAGVLFVLRHAFPGLRLIATSRSEPLPGLHRFRTAGRLTEIRNADLRFTLPETSALLQRHGLALSAADLRTLDRRTEGWAAGLRLCAMAMQRAADPAAFVREFTADRTSIPDLLLTEVLDALPEASQDLLLRAAVSERLYPDLANALTERDDAARLLVQLNDANAFVERIDGTGWYHLHPLFAEVLRSQLPVRHPGLEQQLHRRAARWFAEAGELVDALAQATTAGDWRFASEQVVDNLEIGRLATGADGGRLAGLFAAMPPDLPDPAQALVAAACALARGDRTAGRDGLRRADEHLGRQQGATGPMVRFSRVLLELLVDRLTGDAAAAQTAAREALSRLDLVPPQLLGEHPEIPALLLTSLGSAQLSAGHLDAAETTLAQAVEVCGRPGTEQPQADSLVRLALLDLHRGHLRRAEQRARRALAVAERVGPPPARRTSLARLVVAAIGIERNDPTVTQSPRDLATASVEPGEDLVAKVAAAVIRSRLAAAQGDWRTAVTVLHTVRPATDTPGPSGWPADQLAIAESAADLAHGDAAAAVAVLDAADSNRPEHREALVQALLATDQEQRAADLLVALPMPSRGAPRSRAHICLLRAQAKARAGDTAAERRLLAQALELARPEQLRRLFVEAGPWVRRSLRRDPELALAHGWLTDLPTCAADAAADTVDQAPPRVALSARERDVLLQAAQWLSTEEIATELHISANTVKTHLKSIYRKLSASRRAEAVRRAQQLHLL